MIISLQCELEKFISQNSNKFHAKNMQFKLK